MRKNSFILEEHSCCKLFRTTKYYLYFSLLQLILSIALIATLIFADREKAFPMEIVICLLLFSDIAIRYFSDEKFLQKCNNKVDIILLVLVVALVSMQWIGGSVYEPLSQLGYLIFVIRYGFQIYRIFSLVRQSRQLRQMQQMGEITMDDMQISDDLQVYGALKQKK